MENTTRTFWYKSTKVTFKYWGSIEDYRNDLWSVTFEAYFGKKKLFSESFDIHDTTNKEITENMKRVMNGEDFHKIFKIVPYSWE